MEIRRHNPRRVHPLLLSPWLLIIFLLCDGLYVYAEELDIPNVPLFLGRPVKPNVLLLMDDSGSMDWEILRRPETFAPFPDFPNSGNLDITPTRADRDEILESCPGYNVLYYDPTRVYTPWIGNDSAGNAFGNQSITSARTNPYNAAATIDLTNDEGFGDPPGYMTWNDADGDGDFDVGECPDPGDAAYDYANQFTSTVAGFGVNTVMTAADQQNFANWYSYYRKREYVLKRAVTPVINSVNMRVGLGTLHNNNTVGTAISDLTVGTNRGTLLNNTLNIDSANRTPLRQRLEDAGEYFDQGDDAASHAPLGITDSTPILPAAQGGMCQQNFTLLMSDGFWNETAPNVGNADGDGNSDYDGASYADAFSNTLADVAMDFYERDLDTTLDNVVPVQESRNDLNPAQHMVTYTVSFGLNGTLDAGPTDFDTTFAWPEPISDEATTTDDIRHAAWNGRGQFLSANDPEELIFALNNVLNDIEARSGTAASAAANGGSISTESRVYQAQFDSSDWSGKFLSFQVNNNGTLNGQPIWEAGELLNNSDPSGRNLVTMNPVTNAASAFEWATLHPTQQAMLNIDPATGLDDGLGEQRLLALRGGNINNPNIRMRTNVLGDLVNSDPEFVGAPRFFFGFGGYQSFFEANISRKQTVYVGGNDGILHAFDAISGVELFGYIPGKVFPRLNQLTNPDYVHEFYVDGSPVYGDVQLGSGAGGWRSILAAGLRGGGQGLYALDITNPNAFSSSKVLFEFTDAHDADLGFTYATPQIVRMNNDQWAIVIGNGYNNTVADGSASTTGTAALYIIFIQGASNGGISSSDFIKIPVGTADVNSPNGLGSVGVADIDGDARVDYLYAGDLRGDLWRFDVTSSNPSSWVGNGGEVLFSSTGPAGVGQPITAAPVAIGHPLGIGQGALILFGSGKFIETGDVDPATQVTQTFYAVWDRAASPNFNSNPTINRAGMNATTISTSGNSRIIADAADPDWLDTDGNQSTLGWYLDLPEQGERVIRQAISRNGVIFFVSLIPSLEPCVSGGTGFLMAFDANTGGVPNPDQVENPTVFDTNGDGEFNELDNVGGSAVIGLEQEGIPTLPAIIFDPRPLCERDPAQCDTDGDGDIDDDDAGGSIVDPFPPPLNSFRGCGSDGTRIYLYTTTSTGDITEASASLSSINCGRQAWRQRR